MRNGLFTFLPTSLSCGSVPSLAKEQDLRKPFWKKRLRKRQEDILWLSAFEGSNPSFRTDSSLENKVFKFVISIVSRY